MEILSVMPPSSPVLQPHPRAWAILLAVAFVALVIIFAVNESLYHDLNRYSAPLPSPPPIKVASSVRVNVDFGGGKVRAFRGTVPNGISAFVALSASANAGHFAVRTDAQGLVTTIAGLNSENGKSWHVYINNAHVSDVPGNLDVKAGDTLTFRYE